MTKPEYPIRRDRPIRLGLTVAVALVTWTACSAPAEVPPQQVELSEQAIEKAYATPRQVIADAVVVRTTANFFVSKSALDAALDDPRSVRSIDDLGRVPVTLPAVGAMHERTVEHGEDGATTFRFRAKRPAGNRLPPPIRMRVGEVDLYATSSLVVHVLGGKHDLTLETVARSLGSAPVVVAEKGKPNQRFDTVRIQEGRWSTEGARGSSSAAPRGASATRDEGGGR